MTIFQNLVCLQSKLCITDFKTFYYATTSGRIKSVLFYNQCGGIQGILFFLIFYKLNLGAIYRHVLIHK